MWTVTFSFPFVCLGVEEEEEEEEEGEEEEGEDAQLLPLKRFFWFCGGRIAFLQVFRSASATGAICLMHHRPPIHSNEIQLN